MNRLYFRCNGGHYFRAHGLQSAIACPWDGWSCDGLEHAVAAFEELTATGTRPTVDVLREKGLSSEVLRRILLIEFGDDASAFEALAPQRYIHDGRELLSNEVGLELY